MKGFVKKFIPSFLLSWYHFILALLGAIFYWFPSHLRQGFGGQAGRLKVIGVTGTNGKTTTTEMIARVLEESGHKTAVMNSIRFKIGDKEEQNMLKMTMPGRFKIQKFLRQAVSSGCSYAVLEVTSEGILQHRHRFINFEAAVFTNLSPEHIERHGSFENYRQAKGNLFQIVNNIHIINIEDKNSEYFLQFPSRQKFYYSTDKNLDIEKLKINWKLPARLRLRENSLAGGKIENWKLIKATDIKSCDKGVEFIIDNTKFHLNLLGSFNVYNALAAICVGLSQGVKLDICKRAVESIKKISGRMEEIISHPFKVIVDYAVTPDALEKLYLAVKKISPSQKIIAVFGSCGGGRDKWRRPALGKIAAKHCDTIIITNEDPYDESPTEIIEQIAKGAEDFSANQLSDQRKSAVYKILDRREAIKEALKLVKPGDVVIITGKGCEPWLCIADGKKIPWDDRKVVKEEFEKLKR